MEAALDPPGTLGQKAQDAQATEKVRCEHTQKGERLEKKYRNIVTNNDLWGPEGAMILISFSILINTVQPDSEEHELFYQKDSFKVHILQRGSRRSPYG